MAILLGPDEPEAAAAADAARTILTDLGARPFLERLDAAMAARSAPAEREARTTRDPRSAVPTAEARP